MRPIGLFVLAAVALFGCDTGSSAPASGGTGGGAGRDTGGVGGFEDADRRPTTDADLDADEDAVGDTFLADGFARPDVPATTDAGASDTTESDAGTEDASTGDDVDTIDAGPMDVGVDVGTEDVGEPDTGDGSRMIEGTRDCLEYEIFVARTVFDFKGDDIAVRWLVRNICTIPVRFVMPHTNDLFPIAIEKDGESWVWMPDCPGTGGPIDVTFDPGEGWSRGYIWSAADHESRLERCGVEFTRGSEYRIVGYGATTVDVFDEDGMSEAFPLSEPIVIDLNF